MQLFKKIFIKGTVEILTGIHIGDSKESVEIGGVDSPVVRRKDNNQPYIPGSTIKGKMRSLLEVLDGQEETFQQPDHTIGKLFGAIAPPNEKIKGTPSRLIVRDAYLTDDSANNLGESGFTDMPYTEIKTENTINRITGVSDRGLRNIERIPAGAFFDVCFIINIISSSEEEAKSSEEQYLKLFNSGIKLLEDDYLGGSGSRGYGQVKFQLEEPTSKTKEDYLNGK